MRTQSRQHTAFLAATVACMLLAPQFSNAQREEPSDARLTKLEQRIAIVRELHAGETNELDRVGLEFQLKLLEKEFTNVLRRVTIELREQQLEERQRTSVEFAMRDALSAIDTDDREADIRLHGLRAEVLKLRSRRADLEEKRIRLEQDRESNAEELLDVEEGIRNQEAQILWKNIARTVAEMNVRLMKEAERIEQELVDRPAKPKPTIRLLMARRQQLAEEEKRRRDVVAWMKRMTERRLDVIDSLDLARAKQEQIVKELSLRKEQQRRDKSWQLKRLLLGLGSDNKGKHVRDRIKIMESQLYAIETGVAPGIQALDLYDRYMAYLSADLDDILERFWIRITLPLGLVLVTILLHLLITRLLLPRVYRQDRLFIARRLSGYIVFIVVAVVVAIAFLEDIKAIATGLTIAGAALVIALQDLCSAFAGWFVIITSGKVRVGDRIEIDGQIGDVIDIQPLRTTLIELRNWLDVDEPTGRILVVPNNFIFKSKVFNYSHIHPYVWNRVDITVTFETPAKEAFALLNRILEEETTEELAAARHAARNMEHKYGVLDTQYQPKLNFVIADSGVMFNLLFVSHYKRRTAMRNRINERIILEFEKDPKMVFAYPTERHIPTPPGKAIESGPING